MKWKKTKIKDFTSVITGGTPSTSENLYWNNGNIPWLNSGELNQEIVINSKNFITEAGLKNSSSRLMPADTVLMALTGTTTGKTAYLAFEACANQSVTGILPSSFHNSKYLYYYLSSIRNQVLNDAYGGAQKHISQLYVKEIEVPLPPLQIQEQIAETLDKADALQKKDQNLFSKYDELAYSLFHKMFGDPIKNEMCWTKTVLKSVTSKIGSGSTPTGGKVAYKESGISLIRSMNIYDFAFKWKDLAYIDDAQAAKLDGVKVKSKDVLFNITGASVCRCSIVPDEVLPARVNQHVAILRANQAILNPVFLNHLLVSNSVKKNLLKVGSSGGAVMEAITKEKLENYEIILPPIELQNQFEKTISIVFNGKKSIIKTFEKSNQLFDSLIQKIFNSELVA